MKKTLFIFSLMLISLSGLSKADSLRVSPGVYYSHGVYSGDKYSESYSAYVPLSFNDRFFLLTGFDDLKIRDTFWTYKQRTLVVGPVFRLGSYYFKVNYLNIQGDFNYKPLKGYDYQDNTGFINGDLTYIRYPFYFGISYTHMNMKGYKNAQMEQLSLRFDWIPHYRMMVGVRPVYSNVDDGRRLVGMGIKANYLPFNRLLLKVSGFWGERAYYFDPELLTVFNQDDTQKNLYVFQAEYRFYNSLTLVGAIENSKFKSYSINYFVAGIKSSFVF